MPHLPTEEMTRTPTEVGRESLDAEFWPMAIGGVLSGWLITLMVGLLPSAGQSRLPLIVIITHPVSVGPFSHLIAGSSEAACMVVTGQASLGDDLGRFFVSTFAGNAIGDASLAALLNHAPVREELDGAEG